MSRKKKKKQAFAPHGNEGENEDEDEQKLTDDSFVLPTEEEEIDELEHAILEEETGSERNDTPTLHESQEAVDATAQSHEDDDLFRAPREYRKHGSALQRAAPIVIGLGIALAIIGTVAFFMIASQLLSAQQEAVSVQRSYESIKQSIAILDFRGALIEFPKGKEAITALRSRVSGLLFFSWAPFIGPRIAETDAVLGVLEGQFTAGEQLLGIVEQIGEKIFTRGDTPFELYARTLSRQDKAAILDAVVKAVPTIQGVRATLRLAERERGKIDGRKISSELVRALSESATGSAYLQSIIETWLPLAETAPSFLGFPNEKTYLILLQDTSEVRATGGFISHYGILKLRDGDITLLSTDNIYNLDDKAGASVSVPPPPAFSRYFPGTMKRWYLRDSNWATDFSETARQASMFYRLEGGNEHIDGVIAATPEFIRSLLRFTGPVRVQEREYTADNIMERLEFEVKEGNYRRGIAEGKRNEIFGELVAALGERLLKIPMTQWLSFYTTIETRLNEKHVLLYFNSPQLQEFARSRNWTGEIRNTEGDYLMVVDSTFATLKTESVMDKRMAYTVREDKDGFLAARLVLTYTNRATFSDVTTTYRDWVRVYVPEGSELVRATGIQSTEDAASKGALEIARKYGKVEFAGFFTVEPRHTKVVTIEYRLPDALEQQVREGRYSLLLQKQPGISNQRLDGHLSFLGTIDDFQPLGFFNVKRTGSALDIFHDYRTDQEFIVNLKKNE